MKSARLVFSAAVIAAIATTGFADSIVLNNGDKITGTIQELNPSSVIVVTPYAGRLIIDRASVQTLTSEKAVSVVSPTNTRQDLFLSPNADNKGWQETVAFVPPPPPAPPAGLKRHTSLLAFSPDWKNQFALGVLNTTGNDETTQFQGELSFKYDKKPDEFSLRFLGAYGTSNGDQNQGLFAQTAIFRHDFNEKLYGYVDDDIRYDAIKGISLQAQGAIGLGYWVYRTDKFKLDVRGGPGAMYLKTFDGNENTSPSANAALRAEYVFNDRVSLSQDIAYTTSLTDFDIWRIHAETALNFKIDFESGLGMKLAFADDYENEPSAGRKNNDTRLSLALTLDF